eukprot:2460833-Amphidinium_carterae.1
MFTDGLFTHAGILTPKGRSSNARCMSSGASQGSHDFNNKRCRFTQDVRTSERKVGHFLGFVRCVQSNSLNEQESATLLRPRQANHVHPGLQEA